MNDFLQYIGVAGFISLIVFVFHELTSLREDAIKGKGLELRDKTKGDLDEIGRVVHDSSLESLVDSENKRKGSDPQS